MKALASFSILVDHYDAGPGKPAREVRSSIKLFREDDGLIWRIEGPDGDPVDALPRPKTVAQGKSDAFACYGNDGAGVWKMRTNWI